jgi:CBS domain-containing protein
MTKAPDTIGELMTRDVVAVAPDDRVRRALTLMIEHEIGSVVVVENEEPVGIFTERDITRRVLTDETLLDRRVGDVMSAPPVTGRPTDEVVDVFDVMNGKGIRRLPVVEGGRLVGIVTEGDLRRWVEQVSRE